MSVEEFTETLDAPNRFLETIIRDLNPRWPRVARSLEEFPIHFIYEQARRESTDVFLALSPGHPECLPAMLNVVPGWIDLFEFANRYRRVIPINTIAISEMILLSLEPVLSLRGKRDIVQVHKRTQVFVQCTVHQF